MKHLSTLILTLTIALSASAPQTRAADLPPQMIQQIEQLRTDAEARKDMPKDIAGIAQVTTEEASRMFKAKSAIFLDNRSQAQFDTERIQGAQLFPIDELLKDQALAGKLNKSQKYVLYCNGAHCWRSPATALILSNLGYNVLWYRDGLPEWKKNNLPTE